MYLKKKEIIINVDIQKWKLYDLYDNINNMNIPIIIKSEVYLKKNIKYKIFLNYIKNVDSITEIKTNTENNEFIKFKLKLTSLDKYIDIIVYYTRSFISFVYKKEYNISYNIIINEICEILEINDKNQTEKNIDTLFIINEKIDIKILYYILKTYKVENNIFILKETTNISFLKGILYVKIDFYNIKIDLSIKTENNKLEIFVINIKYKYHQYIVLRIINNIVKIYKDFSKDNINKFINKINKYNSLKRNNKSKIKSLRIINPSLFISGYTKHASINFRYIKEEDIIGDKQKMIENNKLLNFNSEWYIANDNVKIKLKKNNKLPNKHLYPYIITSCNKYKNNNKVNYNYKNKIHKYKYTILQKDIISEINPLFLKSFNIKNFDYNKIGIQENNNYNSLLDCIKKASNINIEKNYLYNFCIYNINIIVCNWINKNEMNFEIINKSGKNKFFIVIFRYHDYDGLNIKKPHHELLLYNRNSLFNINNHLIIKIMEYLKRYKVKKFIRNRININKKIYFNMVITQYINNNCIFIKIKVKPTIWISSNTKIQNCIIEKEINEKVLITFNEFLLYKLSIIYYDIKNNYLFGCWVYYNNILVYVPLKIELFNMKIDDKKIKCFPKLYRKYNYVNDNKVTVKFNYIIYDIILLLFREYLKEGNNNAKEFIDKYIIEYKYSNLNLNDIVINSQITLCNEIINYYKYKIPELFDKENRIKVPTTIFNIIKNYILSINMNNFSPIFYTSNFDSNNDATNIKVCHNKNEYYDFINLIKNEF